MDSNMKFRIVLLSNLVFGISCDAVPEPLPNCTEALLKGPCLECQTLCMKYNCIEQSGEQPVCTLQLQFGNLFLPAKVCSAGCHMHCPTGFDDHQFYPPGTIVRKISSRTWQIHNHQYKKS